MGSGPFSALVVELLALSHGITVGLALLAAKLLPDLAGVMSNHHCCAKPLLRVRSLPTHA